MISLQQENDRLKACLNYLRVVFEYGVGKQYAGAPEVVEVIKKSMREDVEDAPPVGWVYVGVDTFRDDSGREIHMPTTRTSFIASRGEPEGLP